MLTPSNGQRLPTGAAIVPNRSESAAETVPAAFAKSQAGKFRDAARQEESGDDEVRFDQLLRKLTEDPQPVDEEKRQDWGFRLREGSPEPPANAYARLSSRAAELR